MKVISFIDANKNRKLKTTRELESKRSQLQGYKEDYDIALKALKRQHFNRAAKLIMDIRFLEEISSKKNKKSDHAISDQRSYLPQRSAISAVPVLTSPQRSASQ